MELEEVLTYAVAVAVPVWLAVEQLLLRRGVTKPQQPRSTGHCVEDIVAGGEAPLHLDGRALEHRAA